MKKLRMTLEELIKLKPTYENPVELICDDGHFIGSMRKIKVVGVHNHRFSYIDEYNDLSSIGCISLEHYPSLKKGKKKKFYQFMYFDGRNHYVHDSLVDENFKNLIGHEVGSIFIQRKLLTDRVFEIEVDDE